MVHIPLRPMAILAERFYFIGRIFLCNKIKNRIPGRRSADPVLRSFPACSGNFLFPYSQRICLLLFSGAISGTILITIFITVAAFVFLRVLCAVPIGISGAVSGAVPARGVIHVVVTILAGHMLFPPDLFIVTFLVWREFRILYAAFLFSCFIQAHLQFLQESGNSRGMF
jgi:hypothetical protein